MNKRDKAPHLHIVRVNAVIHLDSAWSKVNTGPIIPAILMITTIIIIITTTTTQVVDASSGETLICN